MKMNNWISVDTEMPKPEEQVLAHFNDGFIATVSTDKMVNGNSGQTVVR